MYDYWGDGWNGAIWTWGHTDGSVIKTGTLENGASGISYLPCYDSLNPDNDDCYEFVVGTGRLVFGLHLLTYSLNLFPARTDKLTLTYFTALDLIPDMML